MLIAIIRHGQTSWNEGEGERFRGRARVDLDQMGVGQAKATAARIAQLKVSAIYSSPLPRALSTAQILSSPFGLQVQTLDGLIDIDYGRWQGLSLKEAASDDFELYNRWFQTPHLVSFPGGESLEQVRKRVVAAVEELHLQHHHQTIVLVSHKVVCKVLICSILGLDNSHFWQVEQDPCAINLVEIDGDSIKVALLNDTCHLRDLV